MGFAAALILVAAMAGLPAPPKDDDHWVYYDGSWVVANEFVLLADAGQSRADVAAAIAPYGGKLRPSGLEKARMYVATFSFDDAKRLVEIRQALESAGFHVSMLWAMELFSWLATSARGLG